MEAVKRLWAGRTARQRVWLLAAGALAVIASLSLALQSVEWEIYRVPLNKGIDTAVNWVTVTFDPVFDAIKLAVVKVLVAIEQTFLWVPWFIWVIAVGLFTLRVLSWKAALVFAAGLTLIQSMTLWDHAMTTLAVITTSMLLIVITAIPTGIVAARSDRFEALIRPVLDAAQTIPSFVYLIPVIFLLGAGKVPAIFATMVYAAPPAVRLTNLGLRQVSPEIKEAARSFGATSLQMLIKVELPLALRTIMAGVNQATMMAVAMVVIASVIGAGGLGEDVLFALGRVRVGLGFEAGLAILVLAVVLDRLTQAFGDKSEDGQRRH
ncbi:MAG: ABC transporter permease subunit [Chloroflexota bacterium]